jgi:hypothetical protein
MYITIKEHYKSIFTQAYKNTTSFFGLNRKTLSFSIFVIISWFILWKWKGSSAVAEEMNIVIAFLVPFVGVLLIVFLYNLVKAPVDLMNEQKKITIKKQEDIESLKKELTSPIFEWKSEVVPLNPYKSDYSEATIEITLKSGPSIKNCLVSINKLLVLPDKILAERFSTWILKWDGRRAEELEVSLDMSPGISRRVLICASPQTYINTSRKYMPGQPGFHITRATNTFTPRGTNYPPGEYLAKVVLSGVGIHYPLSRWFRISVGDDPNSLKIGEDVYFEGQENKS